MRKKFIALMATTMMTASTLFGVLFSGCITDATVEYKLSDNGTSYVVSGVYGNKRALTEYEIPATYEGLPVVGIADDAFRLCSSLQKITMPNSVVEVGTSAFMGCVSLTDVQLSSGLTVINYNMFAGCRALQTVEIPQNVQEVKPRAFYECVSLTELTLPEGVKEVGKNAFYLSEGLKTLRLPESLTKFYASALGSKTYFESAGFVYYFMDVEIYFAGSEQQFKEAIVEDCYEYHVDEIDGTRYESGVKLKDYINRTDDVPSIQVHYAK